MNMYIISKRMSTLKERLEEAIKESKITKTAIWKACGLSSGAVSQWFSGATQKIEGENLLNAARVLGVNPDWLATGKGRMKLGVVDLPPDSYKVKTELSYPPVYGKAMGGLPDRLFTDEGRLSNGHDEYGEVYSSDTNAFITRVDGNSMIPKYHHGGYALVEPGTDPEIEDDVLIKLTTGQVMLKKLVSRRGGVVLASYSDPVIHTFTPDQIIWMSYVAYPVPARKIKNRV
jgi:phage repressor protein C with HTH and peptisase S24 domain